MSHILNCDRPHTVIILTTPSNSRLTRKPPGALERSQHRRTDKRYTNHVSFGLQFASSGSVLSPLYALVLELFFCFDPRDTAARVIC